MQRVPSLALGPFALKPSEPEADTTRCLYGFGNLLQPHPKKGEGSRHGYVRMMSHLLQSSQISPPSLIQRTSWGFDGGEKKKPNGSIPGHKPIFFSPGGETSSQ